MIPAPGMEMTDMNLVVHLLQPHPMLQPLCQKFIEAEHQNRFGADLGQMLGAIAENKRFSDPATP